ncbi:MAG: hypothetical protein BWY53_00662 [Parcubacteria group bacterium ADurb.Bin326]|nr:MAG: hypothetical protein BWY53_00662 [Parcubacteria group bacterium ADurb.Bin326]
MTQEIELFHGAISINITNHGETIARQSVGEMVEEFKLNFKTANFPDKLEARVVISRANLPGRPIGLTFVGAVAEVGSIGGPSEALIVIPPGVSLDETRGAKQAVLILFSALSLRQSGAFSAENFEELRQRMTETPEGSDPKQMVADLIREIEERDRRNPPPPAG